MTKRLTLQVIPVTLLAAAVVVAGQSTSDQFRYERPIELTAAGPQRLTVDAALMAGAARFHVVRQGNRQVASGGLSDLRLFDEAGRTVPYLVVYPPAAEPAWIPGTILPIAPTKKTSGFEIDFGSLHDINRLSIAGLPTPFMKRFSVEGSGDRTHWTVLVAEATLFNLPEDELRQEEVAFLEGSYRYLRVTWDDTSSARMPLPQQAMARSATAGAGAPPTTVPATVETRPSEPGISRYRVRLPSSGLPIVALDVDAGGEYVHRRAIVTEARFTGSEAAPIELGSATLIRVTRDGVTASAFRIPIAPPSESELEISVADDANPPLDVRNVSAVLAELPWIYFEAAAGKIAARYGNPALTSPAYDLEAARDSIDASKVAAAKWGDARVLVEAPAPAQASPLESPGSALDPAVFKTIRTIESTGGGLVALPLDVHALSYSRGPGTRFADVRVLDASNRQVPYVIERRSEPLSVEVRYAASAAPPADAGASRGRQRSAYSLALPYPRIYPGTLVVETSARVFQRNASIGLIRPADSRHRDRYFETRDEQLWRHADDQTTARPMMLRMATPAEPGVLLVIDEGDNAPLPITGMRLLLPSYRLRFFHPANARLRLAYGRDDLQPPQYDLALLAPRVMGASAREIAAASPPSDAPPVEPLVSHRTFYIILTAASRRPSGRPP
jgi:hypothetical protein